MKDEDPKDRIKRLMQESASTASNVIDFAAAAKQFRRPTAPRKLAQAPRLTISGNNNAGVIGDNNHVHLNVHVSQSAKAAPIKVQPGSQHINSAQAAEVQELVSKVVAVSNETYSFVWGTVKRKFRFSRYELITPETYEGVCKYLRHWIASKQPTADQMTGEEQRKRLLMRIHAEARKKRRDLEQIRSYVSGRFGTNSLAELKPGQLNEVIKEFGL